MRKKLLVCIIAVVCFCATCMVACNEHAHNFDQEVAEESYLATGATCTAKATYYKSCKCGEKGTETFEHGDFAEHVKATEWSKNATHHWYDCTNVDCDAKFDEAEHSFDQEVAEESYLATGATCTEKATYYKSCECGEKSMETFEHGDYAEHTKATEWSKNGTHHWYECTNEDCKEIFDEASHVTGENLVCSVCDGEEYTEGLIFGLSEDGQSYYVVGKDTATATEIEIIIPSIYEGKPVIGIEMYVFLDCSMTSVKLPDSIVNIPAGAFRSCANLTSINIPNGVTEIGENAFVGCTSLLNIEIPDSVVSIKEYAFYGCSSLTNVTIGNGVTSIGNSAFYKCSSLVSIEIPDSVREIGKSAFYWCASLTNVTIGNGVTSIGNSAFFACSSLASIEIPDSVREIGKSVFCECASLTNATIGNGVTSIGERAFADCSSLANVFYKGSAEDWNKISIGNDNTAITSATRYYYSETEPALNGSGTDYDGNYWHYDTDGKTPVVWKKAQD